MIQQFFQELGNMLGTGIAWVIVGVSLGLLELMILNMVALTLGGAAILTSAGFFVGIYSHWYHGSISFALCSILAVIVLRRFVSKPQQETEDINEY